jgi:hypothetical protein
LATLSASEPELTPMPDPVPPAVPVQLVQVAVDELLAIWLMVLLTVIGPVAL